MTHEYLILDCETTTFQKGHPYSQCNKLCLVGIRTPTNQYIIDIEYSDHSYADNLRLIQEILNETRLILCFNGKFDLAWLSRYSLDYSHCRIWDCQLVHFILSSQQEAYPSLNQVAEHYNLGTKLDEVAELWKNGIDTTQIPLDLLTEYLIQDLALTEQIYLKQVTDMSLMPKAMQKLISLSNQDLLVLLEMETNGIKLNFPGMKQASITINEQIELIKGELNGYFSDIPAHCLNYNSGDVLSALLYGGTIREYVRTVVGQYKSGPKLGQDRYRVSEREHVLLRKYTPPRGSELKKEGFYATNEATLRSIKTGDRLSRTLLDKILELGKLEKLSGTYYSGLEKLHREKDWEEDYLHGQFNQVVAVTGRLSSSSPNLQNFPKEVDDFIVSRYG